MKLCKFCQISKKLDQFYKDSRSENKVRAICKDCTNFNSRRHHWLHKMRSNNHDVNFRKIIKPTNERKWLNKAKREYGLTELEFYRIINKKQCAICKIKEPGKRNFQIDHCHKTGKIRGLLCINCNTGLGQFKDKIAFLKKAIEYLKETK